MFECHNEKNAKEIVRKYFQGLSENHVSLMQLYLSKFLHQNQNIFNFTIINSLSMFLYYCITILPKILP